MSSETTKPFPDSDHYWVETYNFVKEWHKDDDHIFGPIEFSEKFSNHASYASSATEDIETFHWAIIHKGLLKDIDYLFLNSVTRELFPVFSNDVFVVFCSRPEPPRISASDPHVKALWNALQSPKLLQQASESLSGLHSTQPRIFWDPKEIGILSRRNIETACRTASQATYMGNDTLLCRVLTKYLCYVNTNDKSLTPHLCMTGYWEVWITQALARIIQPSWNCIDIGANFGYYSLLMADIVGSTGRVLAVEPNPNISTLLSQSLEASGFNPISEVVQKAVTNESNTKVKLTIPSTGKWADASISRLTDPASQSIEVETITLDELTQDWDHVDLIKIDAEGAEDTIWEGMHRTLQQHRDVIVIMEFCPHRYQKPRILLQEIVSAGFPLRYIDTDSQIKELTLEECLSKPQWDLFLQRGTGSV